MKKPPALYRSGGQSTHKSYCKCAHSNTKASYWRQVQQVLRDLACWCGEKDRVGVVMQQRQWLSHSWFDGPRNGRRMSRYWYR